MSTEEDDDALEAQLERLAKAFTEAHGGVPPTLHDIHQCPEWSAVYNTKRQSERDAALFKEGGCKSYIMRRRRFCAHKAGDGLDGFCSEHYLIASGTEPLAKLRLEEHTGQGKRNLKRRMKRMTNPSSSQFAVAAVAPDWVSVYSDPTLPLLLDVGCAKGRFLSQLAVSADFASTRGRYNFCGVEIFAPLVVAANEWKKTENLTNLHFVAANINSSFESLKFPNLTSVCIQFPDPWHKDNAAKRVVTPELVEQIALALPLGTGELYVVSDMEFLMVDMCDIINSSNMFELHPMHVAHQMDNGYMSIMPFGLPTERDKVCEVFWRPTFRCLFRRRS